MPLLSLIGSETVSLHLADTVEFAHQNFVVLTILIFMQFCNRELRNYIRLILFKAVDKSRVHT